LLWNTSRRRVHELQEFNPMLGHARVVGSALFTPKSREMQVARNFLKPAARKFQAKGV